METRWQALWQQPVSLMRLVVASPQFFKASSFLDFYLNSVWLLPSVLLWQGLLMVHRAHFSAEERNWFIIYFFSNPYLLPLSQKPHFSSKMPNTVKYWRCVSMIHKGCPQSNSSPTDVIHQPLSAEATPRDRKEAREGKEKNEEQKNDQEAFWRSAGGLIRDPTCCTASTQTHTDWNNSKDVASISLCEPLTILVSFFPPSLKYLPSISPTVSRLSLVDNTENNVRSLLTVLPLCTCFIAKMQRRARQMGSLRFVGAEEQWSVIKKGGGCQTERLDGT